MNSAGSTDTLKAQVFIFPARLNGGNDRQVFFLFSLRQIVEVLHEVQVHAVPFAPLYAEGVAQWRGHVLPVLTLERCLRLPHPDSVAARHRSIVVRGVQQLDSHQPQELYCILKLGAAARKLTLPLTCRPIAAPRWVPDPSYLKGIYEWEDRLLLVVHLEKIIGVAQMPELKKPVQSNQALNP